MAYTTLAIVRALPEMEDVTVILDAHITDAIDYATELIDHFTGTSWEAKAFTTTLTGNGKDHILLRDVDGRVILYPQTLSSVTIDSVAQTTTDWALYPEGLIVQDSTGGGFTFTAPGRNIVVSGTAGITSTVPEDIQWCARVIARQNILERFSRVNDRATTLQTADGQVNIAVASAHPDRPTAVPEVNARLVRRRQIGPVFF